MSPDADRQTPDVMIGNVIDLVADNQPAAALRLMTDALAAVRAQEGDYRKRYDELRAAIETLLRDASLSVRLAPNTAPLLVVKTGEIRAVLDQHGGQQ